MVQKITTVSQFSQVYGSWLEQVGIGVGPGKLVVTDEGKFDIQFSSKSRAHYEPEIIYDPYVEGRIRSTIPKLFEMDGFSAQTHGEHSFPARFTRIQGMVNSMYKPTVDESTVRLEAEQLAVTAQQAGPGVEPAELLLKAALLLDGVRTVAAEWRSHELLGAAVDAATHPDDKALIATLRSIRANNSGYHCDAMYPEDYTDDAVAIEFEAHYWKLRALQASSDPIFDPLRLCLGMHTTPVVIEWLVDVDMSNIWYHLNKRGIDVMPNRYDFMICGLNVFDDARAQMEMHLRAAWAQVFRTEKADHEGEKLSPRTLFESATDHLRSAWELAKQLGDDKMIGEIECDYERAQVLLDDPSIWD